MDFAQPGWLALLLLIPAIGLLALGIARLRRRQWTAFVAPRLSSALVKGSNSLPHWCTLFFLLAACVAASVALARPRAEAGNRTEKTLGRNVLIALDISRSMRVSDVKPDRLTQAKVAIYEMMDSMPNERIGLLAFAGTPFIHAPLTVDHTAVRETVEQLDETWAPHGGSDIISAIELATETLKKTGQKNNALVLISDGEENLDDEASSNLSTILTEAEKSGICIISIGVGTENGGFVPNKAILGGQMVDASGRPIISRLQPQVLRKLADETEGRFLTIGSGVDLTGLVKSVVQQMEAFEMAGREKKVYSEFYQWLLLPGVLFLFIAIITGTRWRKIQMALFLGGIFLTVQPQAFGSEESDAKDALKSQRYLEARDAYHRLAEDTNNRDTKARFFLGEATAAYRAEDFRNARTAYSQALLSNKSEVRATSHLGLANSLFQLSWQGLTDKAYPSNPTDTPDLDGFDAIVRPALAEMRKTDSSGSEESVGIRKFESIITNWSDAIRHYDTAHRLFPKDKIPTSNRQLTVTYLKRLKELLEEENEATEQLMPQPEESEDPSNQGDDDNPSDGKKTPDKDQKKPGESSDDESEEDGKGDKDEDKPPEGADGKKPDEEKPLKLADEKADPNESPKERAQRILKDNADLEKGPLTPAQRQLRDPLKDW